MILISLGISSSKLLLSNWITAYDSNSLTYATSLKFSTNDGIGIISLSIIFAKEISLLVKFSIL